MPIAGDLARSSGEKSARKPGSSLGCEVWPESVPMARDRARIDLWCRLSCSKSPKTTVYQGGRSMAARARRARRTPEQPPSASDEEQVKEEQAWRRECIGFNIRKARKAARLSQRRLATRYIERVSQ
jgi:ribosome-binding protein aMBF1 (putative translation factor)